MWIKLYCSLLYQEKNGNKYEEDLEMEIHSVIKTHVNSASMLDAGMQIESNTAKDEESC